MSFQDMGKSSRAGGGSSPKQSFGGAPSSRGNALTQISEGLNQYQRNVGILEKIVQQLGLIRRQGGGSAVTELQMQYDVQIDVVKQLEQRVEQQLNSAQSGLPQIVKLKRDFQRVQTRVKTLQSDVQRMKEAAKAAPRSTGADPYGGGPSPYGAHGTDAAGTQQQQLQMQQDRLAEEIMREREAEIRNINQGMHQVNEIYKDLAHIVGSQQEQIDTIETQMEESRANAEQGLKQVEKANEKYGNSQCIIS
eukprot:Sro1362_g266280.2  (250) ;mRNA; r:11908-12805